MSERMYNHFQQHGKSSYTISDLLKGKDIEIIAATLLLLGKLKVDSVQIYRSQPIIYVSLLGEFKSSKADQVNTLTDFLAANGDLTMDEVFEGIKKRMNSEEEGQ
ncbi:MULTISPECIES: hypothetical protein [Sporosarcina]|uniref:Uncharacterized protein n=1 Tax=Sporosarcina saromensis TaxID=359365 RepID=A0ABU4G4Z8_9BACL|nr:hypothetical protein [Sporosarcina saromensis]MDW0112036.1 hypothetical protein [Sporosarcina saromensis]